MYIEPEISSNHLPIPDNTALLISEINGQVIEERLLELASIGGTKIDPIPEQPVRFGVNRVALSTDDVRAREELIKPWMSDLGMKVIDHPLGVVGIYEGTEPEKEPLLILSHTDSVPWGDMYDGNLGVIGGIEVVRKIKELGISTRRTIMVASLTGEESSGFGIALFGSRAMFHGLTEKELDSRNPGGQSIREVLGEAATDQASKPFFGPNRKLPTPLASIELHVEQDSKLYKGNLDLGIVNAVAAPIRHQIGIGKEFIPSDQDTNHRSQYLRLTVQGKADHSGATPMGAENRADGLVATAQFLRPVLEKYTEFVTLADLTIMNAALNKIPGAVTALIKVAAESADSLEQILNEFHARLNEENNRHNTFSPRFDENPLSLEMIEEPNDIQIFPPAKINPTYIDTFRLIELLEQTACGFADKNVVGTIGTYRHNGKGLINLGLDMRGIDKTFRDRAVEHIKHVSKDLDNLEFGEALPGSGDPVVLDSDLVNLAIQVIDDYQIGSRQQMYSAAGHDAQNAQRAGIPSVMIFCQSRDGIAHHPDAWTSPQNLEKGVKALAALTLKLAT